MHPRDPAILAESRFRMSSVRKILVCDDEAGIREKVMRALQNGRQTGLARKERLHLRRMRIKLEFLRLFHLT